MEAAESNKKRHDKKLAKRDRIISSFFVLELKIGSTIQSSTASPYTSLKHIQKKLKKSTIKKFNAVLNPSLLENNIVKYPGRSSARSQSHAKKTPVEIKAQVKTLHKVVLMIHRKTKHSRIWDYFKAKTA